MSFFPRIPLPVASWCILDPPYLHHTRSSSRRYRFDYEEQDHIELLSILKRLPCAVMLSGYPSVLYDELLTGWGSLELQVMNQGGVRTEKLWFNFAPDRVHWPRYAGKNFTDRQRIKRKAESWGRRYQSLPRAERLAVLSSIMAVEARGNVVACHAQCQGHNLSDQRLSRDHGLLGANLKQMDYMAFE